MKKLVVPKFATEAEEARWWDRHMEVVGSNLVEAIRAGTAKRGGPRRVIPERRESKNITIRVAIADLERARVLAARKGIGYQTYMKLLLQEALDHQTRQAFARVPGPRGADPARRASARHRSLISHTSATWQPRPAPPTPGGRFHSSTSVPSRVTSGGAGNSSTS